MRFALALVLALAPALLLAGSLGAQTPDLSLRGGLAVAGTGNDNCTHAPSLAAGVEVRSRGSLFAGGSADLHVAGGLACTDRGLIVPGPDGRYYWVEGGNYLLLGPRVGALAGASWHSLEGSIAGGVLWSMPDDSRGPGGFRLEPQPWATLRTAVGRGRWSVQLEGGRHRVVIQHRLDGSWIVGPPPGMAAVEPAPAQGDYHFHRWEGLYQLGVRRRI